MSDPEPLIRTLQPEDVSVCARIYRLAYEALAMGTTWDEPTAARIIMEMRRRFPEECFVAEWDGAVVGFILCSSLAGLRATIEELAVAPEHQERGLGGHLMDHAINHCRRRGLSFVELVAHRHSPAWRFYRRRGFRESADYRLMTREL
jgi:ribosomal protein S18 acetylase RimI-like enzyme